MSSQGLVVLIIFLYVMLLFAIAYFGDKASKKFPRLLDNSFIYSLSISVYCTSWTFYGSVGLAATKGLLFVTIYLGAMLSIIVWWSVLRKLVRIKNKFRITSIVDFVSARYDKSEGLGIVSTILLIVGLIPYIALQLKAITKTIHIISNTPENSFSNGDHIGPYVVLLMSACTIFFGLRKLNTTERHPGLILVLVFECFIKLAALVGVGLFVTYSLNNGFNDILEKIPKVATADYTFMGNSGSTDTLTWVTYLVLSASAILFLPRQFHIAVIENSNERHIKTAKWLFPTYLFAINLFILPIAIGGLLIGLDIKEADYFVLMLAQLSGSKVFSLFVFVGGFSAATGMIMLETMTIATIISNNVFLPICTRVNSLSWLPKHLLKARWLFACLLITLSYAYADIVGDKHALLSMGLISFVGSLQLTPVILGSLFWKNGSKAGAYAGIISGALIWFYTLMIPSFIKSGYMSIDLLEQGPFGLHFLKPEALFGLTGLHSLTHALFWTMLFNVSLYIAFSIFFPQSESEQKVADEFYNALPKEIIEDIVYQDSEEPISLESKREQFQAVLLQYFSKEESSQILEECFIKLKIHHMQFISILKLADLYNEMERVLAGYIGTATAHYTLERAKIISQQENERLLNAYADLLSTMKINPNDLKKQILLYAEKERLMEKEAKILEETIKKRTLELEEQKNVTFHVSKMSALGEMAGGIAHEINNPLTIISTSNRAIKKLIEKDKLDKNILLKYCDDIDRTILRISKIITGLRTVSRDASNEDFSPAKLIDIINDVLSVCSEKYRIHGNDLRIHLDDPVYQTVIICRRVQLSQVFLNLLGNSFDAIENLSERWIQIDCRRTDDKIELRFTDSGKGIPMELQEKIFRPFFTTKEIGKGTGLGLSLSNSIIQKHKGTFEIDNHSPHTCFVITLPINGGTNGKA